jgi:hypothetical protein
MEGRLQVNSSDYPRILQFVWTGFYIAAAVYAISLLVETMLSQHLSADTISSLVLIAFGIGLCVHFWFEDVLVPGYKYKALEKATSVSMIAIGLSSVGILFALPRFSDSPLYYVALLSMLYIFRGIWETRVKAIIPDREAQSLSRLSIITNSIISLVLALEYVVLFALERFSGYEIGYYATYLALTTVVPLEIHYELLKKLIRTKIYEKEHHARACSQDPKS